MKDCSKRRSSRRVSGGWRKSRRGREGGRRIDEDARLSVDGQVVM